MKTILASLTIGLSVLFQSPLRAEVAEPSPQVTQIPAPVSGAPSNLEHMPRSVNDLGPNGEHRATPVAPQVAPTPDVPSYNDPIYTQDAKALTDLGNSTVQIISRTEKGMATGSVTVFQFRLDNQTVSGIITNAHVVKETAELCKKTKGCTDAKVIVRSWITRDGKVYPVQYTGKALGINTDLDLAIVILDDQWVGDYANFAPADINLAQSERVFVVGSPAGERTQVSTGLINLLNSDGKIGVSAPTFPGNSGGGAYVQRDKFYYVGIPTSVKVIGGATAFEHAQVIPANIIRGYLNKFGVSPL